MKILELFVRRYADILIVIAATIVSGWLAWLLLASISPVRIDTPIYSDTHLTVPPNSLITVDARAWAKTADTIMRTYGEACNKALAANYGGDYGDTGQYQCVPVRGAVYLERNGRTIGEPVKVRLPWEAGR